MSTESVNARLRSAITRWHTGKGEGINAFAAEMAARMPTAVGAGKRRGTNRATILRYLAKDATTVPPIDFLAEAADLLGVSFEWLALGRSISAFEEDGGVTPSDVFFTEVEGLFEGRFPGIHPYLDKMVVNTLGHYLIAVARVRGLGPYFAGRDRKRVDEGRRLQGEVLDAFTRPLALMREAGVEIGLPEVGEYLTAAAGSARLLLLRGGLLYHEAYVGTYGQLSDELAAEIRNPGVDHA